jgi:hypothetical protein
LCSERAHHAAILEFEERAHGTRKDDDRRTGVAEDQQVHVAAEGVGIPAMIVARHPPSILVALAVAASRLVRHSAFPSRVLERPRDVVVYLPPGYDEEPARRYPVLYMHDGQNLFDPETAFVRGQHWRLGEMADMLIAEGRVEPLVIVGVYHTGHGRVHEYTPTKDARIGGGEARLYGRLLVEGSPFIDARYRTDPARERTGLGGSSLGGLVSMFLGLRHADVFGQLAVMSPSVWWGQTRHPAVCGEGGAETGHPHLARHGHGREPERHRRCPAPACGARQGRLAGRRGSGLCGTPADAHRSRLAQRVGDVLQFLYPGDFGEFHW